MKLEFQKWIWKSKKIERKVDKKKECEYQFAKMMKRYQWCLQAPVSISCLRSDTPATESEEY